MSEDGVQKQKDLDELKAQVGSQQTQSNEVVDLAEIQSKLGAKKVAKSIVLTPVAGEGWFNLPFMPILGEDNRVGSFGNTSVSFSDGLTTEIEWNETYREDTTGMTVGQYAIDYDDGTVAYNSSTSGDIVATFSVPMLVMETINEALRSAEVGSITYYGYAAPGTATDKAAWKIKKIDGTGDIFVQWADGNDDYDNIWDNHASLSYS